MKFVSRILQLLYVISTVYVALGVVAVAFGVLPGLFTILPIVVIGLVVLSPLNYSWIKDLRLQNSAWSRLFIGLHVLGILLGLIVSLLLIGFIGVEFGN